MMNTTEQKRLINIENWKRKNQYNYFYNHDNPFFNICADIKVTKLKKFSTDHKHSFFILSFFGLLDSVNQIDEFKYRISENNVILFDKIRGACTIARPDMTFGFGYFDYIKNFQAFEKNAIKIIDDIKNSDSFDGKLDELDMIHASVLPWVSFKSVEHSKSSNSKDSIPKIVLGKLYKQSGELFMPISISGHHSLMDGLHVGIFMELYANFCEFPELFLT